MAEKIPNQSGEHLTTGHEHLALPTAEQAEKLRPGETDPQDLLESARQEIAETAVESDKPLEKLNEAAENTPQPQNLSVTNELKAITLRRELKDIRLKLPPAQRALSKVIHQPAVRVVSDAASGTISRPSGLLGGGLVALIGTSIYLYLAKTADIGYNSFVFLALFFGGFLVGLVLEFLVHLATSGRRHSHD